MKKLIVIRGVSSSGKSTKAKEIVAQEGGIYLEADQYFTSPEGEYKFEASKLGLAHGDCFRRFREATNNGVSPIVVSNTSTRLWEIEDYLAYAKMNGYVTQIVSFDPDLWNAAKLSARNTHGVTAEQIQKQIDRYQRHPEEIILPS